jgi:hypothetical protein
MLQAISRTKTLPFLEYWCCTVALSKIGNHVHMFLEREVTCCTDILCPTSANPTNPTTPMR